MTIAQMTISDRLRAMELAESRFADLVLGGDLRGWPPSELAAAIDLTNQHKRLAVDAITRRCYPQALSNIDTVIAIMGVFIDDDLRLN